MIIEFIVNMLCSFLQGLLSTVKILALPVDAIDMLGTFCAYGAYIVGAEFLLTFASVVFMWMTIKLTVGIGLFIWRLLPLT